ncbi:EamA family transporter [Clostridium cylindrosporum]|uniref:Putative transporter, EamA-like family n=1 Tax=Clostridium cylindrosporum DSM 605 TaxID=1121307 RepID=A0A0J8DD26_CLOCY|nr:EamA family transporter [Clostridium cylindrosporum]KMT22153.1 putative transporter, EamA-like family [Clostridium cylindrosporum DSM 605]
MVFWIAIFAMVCWGIAPIFAKMGLSNLDPLTGLILRTFISFFLMLGFMGFRGFVSCDKILNQIINIPIKVWFLIAIEALLATLVGDLAYYAAIKKGNVSVVTVIMSSSPLVTMLVSTIFLGEQITFTQIIGVVFVIAGILFIV